jgi:hypothetical protein
MSEYTKVRKQIESLEKEAQKLAKSFLMDGLKELFREHKDVGGISWTQGTPSFNDGDPCTFSSSHDSPELLAIDEVDIDLEELEDKEDRTPVPDGAYAAFEDFMSQIDPDDMERIFGDGVRVEINRKLKVHTSEYYD